MNPSGISWSPERSDAGVWRLASIHFAVMFGTQPGVGVLGGERRSNPLADGGGGSDRLLVHFLGRFQLAILEFYNRFRAVRPDATTVRRRESSPHCDRTQKHEQTLLGVLHGQVKPVHQVKSVIDGMAGRMDGCTSRKSAPAKS
jgi:hypothetical protein